MHKILPHTNYILPLTNAFNDFKERSLTHRRVKHRDIEPLIQKLEGNTEFQLSTLGQSVQNRSIYQIEYGSGDKEILLWSQMHGDESTATMALFDIFNFLSAKDDQYDSLRKVIKEKTKLHFIPMLNPDGAEIFNRRNALGIDINRDARSGTTPEGTILIEAAKRIQPQYGFNLHDQQRYYTVGYSDKAATISFLAPAYNYEKDINDIREDAMKIIVSMNETLQRIIPNGVAKYNDTHEPRGFGDSFQSWGARTVLIESGGYPNDPEKQYIRKLNFIIILNAILNIANDDYRHYNASEYEKIPDNRLKLNELLIRNLSNTIDSFKYKTDIAIKRDEINSQDSSFYIRGRIDDVGDLKESFGYEELDADGLVFQEGKVYETTIESIADLNSEQALSLLRQGYFAVKVRSTISGIRHHNLPLVIIQNNRPPFGRPLIGSPANFFLKKDNDLKYAIINGYLIDLENPSHQNYNQYIQ